ncbi:lysine-2,3-aminomutase-like protein [Microvirga massiliensis]|uniref:lysine-2,3-aminomutase-like protein n=1 Tax=Microvirga massiliensis TaxID=1033741 RepID=UPI00062B7CEE|nr:lysine-2,3-aminomutase-like protein [Microvirga massiliensis]
MSGKPQTLRHAADLARAGLVDVAQVPDLERVAARYAVAVPPALADLIDRSDPLDPIARQFIPQTEELDQRPEELLDPIGDGAHSPVEGIVHRYPDRVLLKAVHTCPVYCRFCFRREVVGPGGMGSLTANELESALAYIAAHPAIWEVILTGGDPLILSPRRLSEISKRLAAMDHVKVLRLHTRVPVAQPELIDEELLAALKESGKAVYIALHANHAREFSKSARLACARILESGIAMVSQTVLLRGVNDDPDTLATLMRTFVENQIKPYYLHHPDLAPGTSHFRLTIEEGLAIVGALRGRLSGLCQPTYVLDIPGGYGKVPIDSHYVVRRLDGSYKVTDPEGRDHRYPPRRPTR